jgi:hypothetical protein
VASVEVHSGETARCWRSAHGLITTRVGQSSRHAPYLSPLFSAPFEHPTGLGQPVLCPAYCVRRRIAFLVRLAVSHFPLLPSTCGTTECVRAASVKGSRHSKP